MARPLKAFTKRAAETVQLLLAKNIPVEPVLSPDVHDENVITLNELLDVLADDIEELNDAFNDLKNSNEKWSSLIQRAAVAERAALEASYDDTAATLRLDQRMQEGGERLRILKDLDRKIKALKRREEKALAAEQNAAREKSRANLGFKPPKQEMAKFSGRQIDWPEWWQIYKATVHDSESSAELKHAILKQSVEGEAKMMISGLTLADYAVAIDLLEKRYGSEEEYIRSLHNELDGLKPCRNFKDVRKFALEVERLCRLLAAHGQNISGQGTWMNLERKLTVDILRELQTKKDIEKAAGRPWDTQKFRTALTEIVQKEELIWTIHGQVTEKSEPKDPKPKPDRRHAQKSKDDKSKEESTSAFASTTESKSPKKSSEKKKDKKQRPKAKYPCVFCEDDGHWPDECTRCKTVQERKAKLRELKKCFKCFRQYHPESECTKKPRACFHCKELKHSSALCEQKFGGNSSTRHESTSNAAFTHFTGAVKSVRNAQPKRILLCRESTIFNPTDLRKKANAIIFIDCGSQRSYIRKEMAQKLGLQSFQTEHQRIQPFPPTRSPILECQANLFRLGLETLPKGQWTVEVGQLDDLNNLVNKMPVVLAPEDEMDFDFSAAKIPGAVVEPDLLLGVEYFFDLNIVRRKHLNSGFWLADSILGPLIGGKGNLSNTCAARSISQTWSLLVNQNARMKF